MTRRQQKYAFVYPNFFFHRPLPRGLLRFEEAKTAVNLTQVGLIAYGVLLGVRFSWSVGLLFILQVPGWSQLRVYNFVIDTHNVIIIPL